MFVIGSAFENTCIGSANIRGMLRLHNLLANVPFRVRLFGHYWHCQVNFDGLRKGVVRPLRPSSHQHNFSRDQKHLI